MYRAGPTSGNVRSETWVRGQTFTESDVGFAFGHSHEVQILLSRQLGRLATKELPALVLPQYQGLLSIFEGDHVALAPATEQIPNPLFLLPGSSTIWPAMRPASWRLGYDVRITGDECFDLLIEILLETLGLGKEVIEPIGKLVWKFGDEEMFQILRGLIRTKEWGRVADVVAKLLERLVSRDFLIAIGEIVGIEARKKFITALAARFVPFVGTAILVITFVCVARSNWPEIQKKCESSLAKPHA